MEHKQFQEQLKKAVKEAEPSLKKGLPPGFFGEVFLKFEAGKVVYVKKTDGVNIS